MTPKSTRKPRFAAVSDEMKRISALLAEECKQWPKVETRPMFGMLALYRDKSIFALLPRTKASEMPNSIAYKLAGISEKSERKKWRSFEFRSDADFRTALEVLDKAYRSYATLGKGHRQPASRGAKPER
jgi:hypothetical protein